MGQGRFVFGLKGIKASGKSFPCQRPVQIIRRPKDKLHIEHGEQDFWLG